MSSSSTPSDLTQKTHTHRHTSMREGGTEGGGEGEERVRKGERERWADRINLTPPCPVVEKWPAQSST